MGFMRDVARVATFGVVGSSLLKKNKKLKEPAPTTPRPTMISSIPLERAPTSMIGPSRGGY